MGDEIIVATQVFANAADITAIKPKVLTFKENNQVDEILTYYVEPQDDWYSFGIDGLNEQETSQETLRSGDIDVDRIRHDLRAEGVNEQTIEGFFARHLSGKAA